MGKLGPQKGAKKTGRPPKPIDWDEFEKLARMQCTEEEIAAWFSCGIDTIRVACHERFGCSFQDYFAEKKAIGRISLRRLQLRRAEAGSDTMLVWLGKNALGQRDKFPEEEEQRPVAVNIVFTRAQRPAKAGE